MSDNLNSFISRWKNEDGTYNAAGMLAELSGVSQEEVVENWEAMKKRIAFLTRDCGMERAEAAAIAREELRAALTKKRKNT